jgi:hypothetical protein
VVAARRWLDRVRAWSDGGPERRPRGGALLRPGSALERHDLVRPNALLPLANGDLIVGGDFTTVSGVIALGSARWNGSVWSPLGAGLGRILSLTQLPNGDLIAAGDGSVLRWNGVSWSFVGLGASGPVRAVVGLPNGDVVAVGTFLFPNQPAGHLVRWNGTAWLRFAGDIDGFGYALARLPNDDVVVGGDFLSAGGQASAFLAQVSTTCPATAVPFGTGCAGSGGTNTHAATALPWLGATFRAEASGMPANGFVAAVTGFSQLSLPLSLVLPPALPGCQGLVSPDAVEVLWPIAGRVQTQLAIPPNLALVGLALHQYVVAFEFGGAGQISAITSSNALTLTVGSF